MVDAREAMSRLRERASVERRWHDARLQEANIDRAPFTVAWEVTRACAYRCRHCRAEAQPRRHPLELSSEEAFRLVDQIREMGDPILVVTGGDPMMRPDLFDILSYATHRGLRVALTPTTTRLVTRQALRRAARAGVRRLAISIDGPSEEVHDAFRGMRGSFRMALAIAKAASEEGLPLQVNTTLSRWNSSLLGQMATLVAALEAVQWSIFFLVPVGRALREDMLTPQEHEEAFHRIYELSKRVPYDVKVTSAPAYRRVVMEREGKRADGRALLAGAGFRYADGLNRPAVGINDGKGFCFVSHLGEVWPSGFLPLSGGNVRRVPIAEIYRQSPLFRALRDPTRLKGRCGRCPYRGVCGGSRSRAYALTGDYLAEDPSCVYEPPVFCSRGKGSAQPTDATLT